MKRLFLILVILIGYLSGFSQEKDINQIRYERYKIFRPGLSPDQIVIYLSFGEINRYFNGGIFIGIGLLSEDSKKPSTYTGTLNLHEYKFIFDNGKLKEKSIDSTKIGSETISGQYIYEFIGKVQTTWSLDNGKFNSSSVAIEKTEEEKRADDAKWDQMEIQAKKRLKEITDSLTIKGYKIINHKGFDSFEIGKTTFEEITNKLGANYSRTDVKKYSIIINYANLGVSFYFKYDRKTKQPSSLFIIELKNPFKGVYIIEDSPHPLIIELNKTNLRDFYEHDGLDFRWGTSDNKRFVSFSSSVRLVIELEKPDEGFAKVLWKYMDYNFKVNNPKKERDVHFYDNPYFGYKINEIYIME